MVDEQAAIAILGPERLGSDSALSDAPTALGRSLARGGYAVVVSGEGEVATEAVRGALEVRGRVIAAVEPNGDEPHRPRPGLTIVERGTVLSRIETVLEVADALVVLPGDLTALAGLLQVWSYGHTRSGPYRPLVLLGDEWPGIVKALADAAGLDRRTRAMVTFASTPDEAVETLRYYVSPAG